MYNAKLIVYDRIYDIKMESRPTFTLNISSSSHYPSTTITKPNWSEIRFSSKTNIDINSASTVYLKLMKEDLFFILYNVIFNNETITFKSAIFNPSSSKFEIEFKNIIKNRIKYVTN
jgi:hypothetical protein